MMSSKPAGAGVPCEPWRVLMYCKEFCSDLRDLFAGGVVFPDSLGRGGVLGKHPFRSRRTLHEIAAAVRAKAAQASSRAVGAEGALVCADERVGSAVWQVLVAAFAVRAQ